MKKYSLTLILVLCLFVITGGTYAAWTYYEGKVANSSQNFAGSGIVVEEAKIERAGSIEVVTSGLVVNINKNAANTKTELSISGSVVVNYTPAGGSASDISDLVYTVAVADSQGAGFTVATSAEQSLELSGNTVSISGETIQSLIGYTPVDLPTKAKYDEYEGKLSGVTITITVIDKSTTRLEMQ